MPKTPAIEYQNNIESCLKVTCNALTANNLTLETQVNSSNITNEDLKNLTYEWTSDLHENATAPSGAPTNAQGQDENAYDFIQNSITSSGDMETFIKDYIDSTTSDMSNFSSALVIQAIAKLGTVWDTSSGSDSPLQMNALTSFLSIVNADATNEETPYQTISRNLSSSLQQNSGATSTISQIGSNINQVNSQTLSILNSSY